MDSEKGPQLRVREGIEPAAFLSLWEGHMVVLKGSRGAAASREPRLFVVQGYDEQEMFVKEVDCDMSSLRARGVFLLAAGRRLLVWEGRSSSSQHRTFGSYIGTRWRDAPPAELGGARFAGLDTVKEGSEGPDFWECLLGSLSQFQRLSEGDIELSSSPRLYHMTSVLGTFEVNEVKPESRNIATVNNLNIGQFLMYEVEQPGTRDAKYDAEPQYFFVSALFLVDCGHCLYLWQGWFPVETSSDSEDEDAAATNIVTTGNGCRERMAMC